MPIPPVARAVATGASLTVIDYRSLAQNTPPAGADGQLVTVFDAPPPGLLWLIGRMTIFTTSATGTTCGIYAGSPTPTNLVDGSNSGNLDVADESSPILLDSGAQLTVVWDGASAGAVGTCRIQYQLVRRG